RQQFHLHVFLDGKAPRNAQIYVVDSRRVEVIVWQEPEAQRAIRSVNASRRTRAENSRGTKAVRNTGISEAGKHVHDWRNRPAVENVSSRGVPQALEVRVVNNARGEFMPPIIRRQSVLTVCVKWIEE